MEDRMKLHAALLKAMVVAGWTYKRSVYDGKATFTKDIRGFPVRIRGNVSTEWILDIPALGLQAFATLEQAFRKAQAFEAEFDRQEG